MRGLLSLQPYILASHTALLLLNWPAILLLVWLIVMSKQYFYYLTDCEMSNEYFYDKPAILQLLFYCSLTDVEMSRLAHWYSGFT